MITIAIKDILSLIFSFMGIIFILFLTYYGTKWLSKKANFTVSSQYINIVDRIVLGQNKYLAIIEITNKFYLLSITDESINIIKELEDFKIKPKENNNQDLNFNKLLSKIMKK